MITLKWKRSNMMPLYLKKNAFRIIFIFLCCGYLFFQISIWSQQASAEVIQAEQGSEMNKSVAPSTLSPHKSSSVSAHAAKIDHKRNVPIRNDAFITFSRPAAVPYVTASAIQKSRKSGVDFLIKHQNRDGSWGAPLNTKKLNVYAPGSSHDGFRAGCTSLCVITLIEHESEFPEVIPALERGEKWILEHLHRVRRSETDALYNVWAHAYGIEALIKMYQRFPEDASRRKKITDLISNQIKRLERSECLGGGWSYYDFDYRTAQPGSKSLSFVTGTVLVALSGAKEIGVEVPQKMIHRSLDSLLRQRRPDGTYLYGEHLRVVRAEIDRPAGCIGRAQSCNLALFLWGNPSITQDVFLNWLDHLIARNGWLDIGRKRPVPHESWFAIAGYFYYYAHYYAVRCVEKLDNPKDQLRLANHLADLMLGLQEKDGSWWDFPLYDYHPYYGTAMALSTLAHVKQIRDQHEKNSSSK